LTELFDPGLDLPEDTLLEMVRIPTRIRNALKYAGIKTVGEIRETSDAAFASIPNLGPVSVAWLRERVGGDRSQLWLKAKK